MVMAWLASLPAVTVVVMMFAVAAVVAVASRALVRNHVPMAELDLQTVRAEEWKGDSAAAGNSPRSSEALARREREVRAAGGAPGLSTSISGELLLALTAPWRRALMVSGGAIDGVLRDVHDGFFVR